nr:keratin, type I cytoskeletal 9-like [Coffea arabica]
MGGKGGNSGGDNRGGNGSSGGSGLSKGGGNGIAGGEYIKALGDDRSYNSRAGFEVGVLEEEPKAVGGNGGGKGSSGGGGSSKGSGSVGAGGGYMKAPGGGGSYISRVGFEANPRGYFSGLRGDQKSK